MNQLAVAVPKYVDLTTKAKKAADDAILDALRASTIMLMASNALSGSNVAHVGATNYWPRRSDIMANIQFSSYVTVYTNRYLPYTIKYGATNFYDFTNGAWYQQ